MANRQQRRADAKRRPGETYADVLARKRMIQAAVEKTAHDANVALEADIQTQRYLWMSVIALNEAFGFGGERAKRYMLALEEVANEFEQMVYDNDSQYAIAKLMQRASQITGIEVKQVHEDEIRKARIENQKEGIFFPEDDPYEVRR